MMTRSPAKGSIYMLLVLSLRARFKTCRPPLRLRAPIGQLRFPIGQARFAVTTPAPSQAILKTRS